MSNRRTLALLGVLVGAVVAQHRYYARRLDDVVSRLRESYAYDTTYSTPSSADHASQSLRDAAEAAGVAPSDLTAWVEAQDERISALKNRETAVRRRWADAWVQAASRDPVDPSGQQELVVVLDDCELDDALELAKRTVEFDGVVAFVGALEDGSFAVTVGATRRDEFSAATLADRVADQTGGGAGGDADLATGGAGTGELAEALRAVRDEVAAVSRSRRRGD